MNRVMREFVSNETCEYRFKVGHAIASSLAGFVGGVIFASIVWVFIVYLLPLRS